MTRLLDDRRPHGLAKRWIGLAVAVPVCVLACCGTALAEPPALESAVSWDDGLSEMCYYDATDTIYGTVRSYTRVHLLNRQWMNIESGVKGDEGPGSVPVFKFVVTEEIPTENYNYRYLTSLFLRRADLAPFKLATTSQEWCGTTYKQLRWGEDGLTVKSFSYFGDEGDKQWQLPADCVPADALPVLAREVAASGKTMNLTLLPIMRSSHQVAPEPVQASLTVADKVAQVTVPFGNMAAKRVTLDGTPFDAWFEVEAQPPHRLLSFKLASVTGQLRANERRAYWDRKWKSSFYEPNQAP